MANVQNFRSGQMALRKWPVQSSDVIDTGDMLWSDTTNNIARPASTFDHDTDLATTQGQFAALFAGIAYEASANGDTDDISVDVGAESIYQFVVVSATYENGDSLGPDENPADTLEDQVLETAIGTSSIARCTERAGSAVTLLLVQFASAYNLSAQNTNAVVG